jgi:hypothetical protein
MVKANSISKNPQCGQVTLMHLLLGIAFCMPIVAAMTELKHCGDVLLDPNWTQILATRIDGCGATREAMLLDRRSICSDWIDLGSGESFPNERCVLDR